MKRREFLGVMAAMSGVGLCNNERNRVKSVSYEVMTVIDRIYEDGVLK